MAAHIRQLTTQHEFDQVFRLRYEVYVGEMGREEPDADHQRRLITDHHDRSAIILGAFAGTHNEELVGTIRFNSAADLEEDEHSFWRMKHAGQWFPHQAVVTTKLIVCPRHRGVGTPIRLASEAFRQGYLRGFRFCFIDCNSSRWPLFRALGFREIGDLARHPRYGDVHIMALNMADWTTLRKIKSPLAEHVDGLDADDAAAQWVGNINSRNNRGTQL